MLKTMARLSVVLTLLTLSSIGAAIPGHAASSRQAPYDAGSACITPITMDNTVWNNIQFLKCASEPFVSVAPFTNGECLVGHELAYGWTCDSSYP
ncbi:MAG: hypothetical protein LC723_13220, partial [Actinobacteria bacterium]|nr:hypothetical protein [Actinomycetota bacterium]